MSLQDVPGIERATPEGLRVRATLMRERGDESCARHLELAAHEIALTTPAKTAAQMQALNRERLGDPRFVVGSFSLETCEESSEARLVFYSGLSQSGEVLGVMVLERDEVYDFGTEVLHCYDLIEGIADAPASD